MKLPPRKRLRSRLNFEQLEDRTTPTSSTVTTLLDEINPDDGVISLREAITAAEADPEADTITFASGLAKGTIALDSALADTGLDSGEVGPTAFNITTPITIIGSGQSITRGVEASDFRFFFVKHAGNLTLENLELNGGSARGGNGFNGGGGAAGLGGAIFNQGTLTIRSSTLVGNRANGGNGSNFSSNFAPGGGGGLGESTNGQNGGGPNGGINGELSGVAGGFGGGGSANSSSGKGGAGGFGGGGGAGGGGGGAGGFGGGGGRASSGSQGIGGFGGLDATSFGSGPGAGMGGAIFNLLGTVNIVNSTITGNTALGGGIPNAFDGSGSGYGGGLFNLNGSVTVVNSTFAANRAGTLFAGAFGNSIYNLAHDVTEGVPAGQDATAILRNSIFLNPIVLPGVGLPFGSNTDEVHNAVFNSGRVSGGAFLATIDASAPNITNIGGFVNSSGTTNSSGVITATRPVVSGTLANNGGPTPTLALTANSEALDAGSNAAAVDPVNAGALANDQRGAGFNRVSNGTVDLGAFEFQLPNRNRPATIVLTSPNFVVVQHGEGESQVIDPYPEFDGETRVAVGDVNRDGVLDFIFSAGDRGGPHIRVISGSNGAVLYNFFAYDEKTFRGGVYIATGDMNGDGYSDIVTGAGEGGAPHVRVFSGKDGSILADFFAYDPTLRTGVTVAVGDVNGDGKLDIVTGPGPNSGSLVKVIDGTKFGLKDPTTALISQEAVFASFTVYGENYADGVFLAVGNLDGDRFADIVAGPLVRGATSQSFVYLGSSLQKVNSFFAEDFSLRVGLRFAMADTNGDGIDELIVVAAPGGGPREIVINPVTGLPIESIFFADENLRTGFGVGAGNNVAPSTLVVPPPPPA